MVLRLRASIGGFAHGYGENNECLFRTARLRRWESRGATPCPFFPRL
jgi:hypothetical protein